MKKTTYPPRQMLNFDPTGDPRDTTAKFHGPDCDRFQVETYRKRPQVSQGDVQARLLVIHRYPSNYRNLSPPLNYQNE